jgi:long-chain acyl-CoA synthetase
MLPGVVIFMRGYKPAAITALIRSRRVSVLVSVPKILDVLREHVVRTAPEARIEAGGAEAPEARTGAGRAETPEARRREHFIWRWWRYRRVHRLFGLKFWAFVVGAVPLETELEAFWGRLGFAVIQGYPGSPKRRHRQPESSVRR